MKTVKTVLASGDSDFYSQPRTFRLREEVIKLASESKRGSPLPQGRLDADSDKKGDQLMIEKKTLTTDDIDTLTALELPPRETPALVVINCLAVCIGDIRIRVDDITIATQICAQVVNVTVLGTGLFSCQVSQ